MAKRGTLLVVDDNRNILTTVSILLEDTFQTVITISNPNLIPAKLRDEKPDVVLLDMNFSSGINNGNEGLYWLREIKRMKPQTQVVLFTAYADIQLAVKGIKEGAADFIVKPFDNEKMIKTLMEARSRNPRKTAELKSGGMFWGDSNAMQELRLMVEKVAPTDANILITGENGTGKEVLANEIHRWSNRSKTKMLPIDMGAITETLFESELFGYVKGAFTDAKADRPGKFELAEGAGEFREDLLYRINTIHLHLPPLRQRRDDIVPLAYLFLKKYGGIYNKENLSLGEDAERKLKEMPWYGNIRELEHAVEKAVILSDGPQIHGEDIEGSDIHSNEPLKTAQTLDEMEQQLIEKTIQECEGNLSVVASRLGISRQTLYNKIKRYGL